VHSHIMTLPYGCTCTLDKNNNKLEDISSAVSSFDAKPNKEEVMKIFG